MRDGRMSGMNSMEQQVVIVVSDDFVSRLNDLTVSSHVRAVRTSATEEVAQRIWDERPPQETDPLTSGLRCSKATETLRMIFCRSLMK
jgi:hypothetical protein